MNKRIFSRRRGAWLTAVLLCASGGMGLFCANAQTAGQTATPAPAAPKVQQSRGERVFMNNCSRCHKPPMTIPPQITGTIVMHMRTRARLSSKDQQDLLRYLAP
jgi:cytochrome c5